MRTKLNVRSPSEAIVDRQPMIAMANIDKFLRDRKFVVKLACGHLTYTRNQNSAVCPRCTEMLRRSIATGHEDYESFRAGRIQDRMEWPGDPCRIFNEGVSPHEILSATKEHGT